MSGLYQKYIIYKAKKPDPCGCREAMCPHLAPFGRTPVRGEEVTNCFVLRPEKDPAARAALKAYAKATDNKVLARDLTDWLASLKG